MISSLLPSRRHVIGAGMAAVGLAGGLALRQLVVRPRLAGRVRADVDGAGADVGAGASERTDIEAWAQTGRIT